MAEYSPDRVGIVEYGRLAAIDFAANHDATAHMWGVEQAERYSDFLQESADFIALNPNVGRKVVGHPTAEALLVRWPKARYGHYIVYRRLPSGIHIMRILHSAMDVGSHLLED